jgi:hypothetical protein
MTKPEDWKAIGEWAKNIWAALGPLVGVLIGAFLAKKWQRAQWIADTKRSEYRKLLTTLTKTFSGLVRLQGVDVAIGPKEQRTLSNLEADSINVIRDRLFIADEIQQLNLLHRWTQALRSYDNTHNSDEFAKAFGLIMNDLQNSASKITKG